MLPLCESGDKEVLEKVLTESGHFIKNGGKWIMIEMANNQDMDKFLGVGKDLQERIDRGEFSL